MANPETIRSDRAYSSPILRFGVICVRFLLIALILMLGLIAYLTIIGVPHSLVDDFVADFNRQEQIGLSLGNVKLVPPDVIQLEEVRIHGSCPDTVPLFVARDCYLRIDWSSYPDFNRMLSKLILQDGEVNQRIFEDSDDIPISDLLVLDDISLQARRNEDSDWIIESGRCRLGSTLVEFAGDIQSGKKEARPQEPRLIEEEGKGVDARIEPRKQPSDWLHTRALRDKLLESGSIKEVSNLIDQYGDFEIRKGSRFEIDFAIRPEGEAGNDILVNWDAGEFGVGGLDFSDLRFAAHLKDGEVNIPELAFSRGTNRVDLSASYALDSKTAAIKGNSSLPWRCIDPLIPRRLRRKLEIHNISVRGGAQIAFELGPAVYTNLVRDFSVASRLEDLQIRSLQYSNLTADLEREGDDFRIKKLDTRIDQGDIQCRGAYNTATKKLSLSGRGDVKPSILNVFSDSEEGFESLRPLDLHGSNLSFQGSCAGTLGDSGAMQYNFDVHGGGSSYNSVDIEKVSSTVNYMDKQLEFADFEIVCTNGAVSGDVTLDFERDSVGFSIQGDCSPRTVAQMIDEKFEEKIDFLSFEGNSRFDASGYVQYSNLSSNRVTARISSDRMKIKDIQTEKVGFVCDLDDRKLTVHQVDADVCGGGCKGNIEFRFKENNATNTSYALDAELEGLELNRLISEFEMVGDGGARSAEGEDEKDYPGLLKGSFHVEGNIGTNGWDISDGTFSVEINDGELYRMPLLGGLSRYLDKIFPGFGYLSQTDLKMEGLFRGDRLLIQNAKLEGMILSVNAHGDYYYEGRLDIVAKVVPMRSGVVASVLRVLTFPVSKVFEFTLTGNLDEPEWRPTNLPKELFLKFD